MASPENGIYVLQGIVPNQIAAAPVGAKVVDLYGDDGQLFSTSQVAEMKSGGGEVFGYFSIGEAENYRSYFSALPSSALGPVDPQWPGNYQVAYWTDAWKTVATNYIDQMIAQGYSGAYFDVVGEYATAWAKANAPNADPAGAMVSLIQYLASYAQAKDPGFQIWINASGAEDLLSNKSLVSVINGAYEEELFYKDSGSPEARADVSYNLTLLENVVAAGKPVVAIEYVTGAAKVASVELQAAAAGIGYYIANPNLALNGVDTEGFPTTTTTPPANPSPAPTVTGVVASPVAADLGRGGVANITVQLSESVTVTGAPKLTLNDGGTASYVSGSGTKSLTFKYTVGSGQNTSGLAVTGVTMPSGASVVDSASNAANWAGAIETLGSRLIVDTTRTRTTVTTGTGQKIQAGHGDDVVALTGGKATLVFSGSNNIAFLGGSATPVSASITDKGQGLTIYVATGGVDKITGFATDTSAVIDLLGGLGGYTSAAQAVSALQSDGAGGALLTLGPGQSIDLVGVAPANLHASNFVIG